MRSPGFCKYFRLLCIPNDSNSECLVFYFCVTKLFCPLFQRHYIDEDPQYFVRFGQIIGVFIQTLQFSSLKICLKLSFTPLKWNVSSFEKDVTKLRFFAKKIKFRVKAFQAIIQSQMCLFFGKLPQQCDHAQCKIVQTIKSLNQQSLFAQVASLHHRFERLTEPNIETVDKIPDDHKILVDFKVEEDPSFQLKCSGLTTEKNEFLVDRVEQLQRQVQELRQMTFWMRNQLQIRGILF